MERSQRLDSLTSSSRPSQPQRPVHPGRHKSRHPSGDSVRFDALTTKTKSKKSASSVYVWHHGAQGKKHCDPVHVTELEEVDVKSVYCGHGFWGVVSDFGQVYMWGDGRDGKLGLGDERSRPTPQLLRGVFLGVIIEKMSLGQSHALAWSSANTLYAWGSNSKGELGLGDCLSRNTPTPLLQLLGIMVESIEAGAQSSALISEDGELMVWGCNSYGKLGIPGYVSSTIDKPEVLQVGCPVKSVCLGANCVLVLTKGGKLLVGGCNEKGQLCQPPWQGFKSSSGLLKADRFASELSFCTTASFGKDRLVLGVTDDGALHTWGSLENFPSLENGETVTHHPQVMRCLWNAGVRVVAAKCCGSQTVVLSDLGGLYGFERHKKTVAPEEADPLSLELQDGSSCSAGCPWSPKANRPLKPVYSIHLSPKRLPLDGKVISMDANPSSLIAVALNEDEARAAVKQFESNKFSQPLDDGPTSSSTSVTVSSPALTPSRTPNRTPSRTPTRTPSRTPSRTPTLTPSREW